MESMWNGSPEGIALCMQSDLYAPVYTVWPWAQMPTSVLDRYLRVIVGSLVHTVVIDCGR